MRNLSGLQKISAQQRGHRPLILNLNSAKDKNALEKLLAGKKILSVSDDYQEQLKELFQVSNPSLTFSPLFSSSFQNFLKKLPPHLSQGNWVYFPWNGCLSHVLPETEFFLVRTARNHNLVTPQEQQKFYETKIGIAGLSVGSSVALAIVLQGGAKKIKLADFDRLSLSNTNRVRGGIGELGQNKAEITARQLYEINPYAQIEIFNQGLTEKNCKSFIQGLDIVVDEMDNMALKLLLRITAKQLKLPIVMGADNGETAVVDIERYDKKKNVKFFHGRIKNPEFKKLLNLNKLQIGRTIAQFIGPENHEKRMVDSLAEIGKTVVSWPQLGGTAMLNGAAVAYCVRQIACGQNLVEKRAIISLERTLRSDFSSKSKKKQRAKSIKKLKTIFQI